MYTEEKTRTTTIYKKKTMLEQRKKKVRKKVFNWEIGTHGAIGVSVDTRNESNKPAISSPNERPSPIKKETARALTSRLVPATIDRDDSSIAAIARDSPGARVMIEASSVPDKQPRGNKFTTTMERQINPVSSAVVGDAIIAKLGNFAAIKFSGHITTAPIAVLIV